MAVNRREVIERTAREIEVASEAGDEQRARRLADLMLDIVTRMDHESETAAHESMTMQLSERA